MGGFLGLNIVYTYAASGEVTQLPIDVAWACTNLWSGIGILLGPFFSGLCIIIILCFIKRKNTNIKMQDTKACLIYDVRDLWFASYNLTEYKL